MHNAQGRHVRQRLQDLDEQTPAALVGKTSRDGFAEGLLTVSSRTSDQLTFSTNSIWMYRMRWNEASSFVVPV